MKILLVIGAFSYGGAERVMCSLANYFCKENKVVLVTLTEREETYFLDPEVKRINGIGWKNQLQGILKLRQIVKKEKPSLVISFIAHINIASILACTCTGVPVIVSERNDPARSATSLLRKVLRYFTYPFANGLVFQTEDAKNYFGYTIRRKSVVIPNPLFLKENPVPFEERKNEIVSVGRFVSQKRQDIIVRAFANISQHFPDYILTFYGSGENKGAVEEFVKTNGLSGKVRIFDAVPDLHVRIKAAKFFVLMSEYEGMPNALMEAMGLGLVCISSDCPCGGPRFLIEHGRNGYLTPVNDEEQLTGILDSVMRDEEKQRMVSQNAIKIRNTLAPDKIFKLWDEYVHNICN